MASMEIYSERNVGTIRTQYLYRRAITQKFWVPILQWNGKILALLKSQEDSLSVSFMMMINLGFVLKNKELKCIQQEIIYVDLVKVNNIHLL